DSGSDTITRLFGESPEAADVVAWTRLAAGIASLHKDVTGGGFDFRGVAEVCSRSTDLLFDDSDRWWLLADVEDAYRERLVATGVVDAEIGRASCSVRVYI